MDYDTIMIGIGTENCLKVQNTGWFNIQLPQYGKIPSEEPTLKAQWCQADYK